MVVGVLSWVLAQIVLGLANTVGYHRLLTHRSFRAPWALRAGLALAGAMWGGSPLTWVALHRQHHARSDGPGDPHSPREGFWFAHCGWLIGSRSPYFCLLFALSGFGQQLVVLVHDGLRLAGRRPPEWRSLTQDLNGDAWMRFLDTPLVIPAGFVAQVAAAWWVGGWWGLFWLWSLHLVLTNGSWAVNSIGHSRSFGVEDHTNGDTSRNVPWLAWLTFGEGWHNHHHRYPRSARHGLGGGFDPSWWVIRGLERAGVVDQVWLPKGERQTALERGGPPGQ